MKISKYIEVFWGDFMEKLNENINTLNYLNKAFLKIEDPLVACPFFKDTKNYNRPVTHPSLSLVGLQSKYPHLASLVT
jgi:hypothetical protein